MKVVIVTGGGSGIGAGLARMMARKKDVAVIVVADIDLNKAREVADEISGHAVQAEAVRCDVGEEAEIRALVEGVVAAHKRVDIFFSNAGIHLRGIGADGVDRHSSAEWQRIWAINVLSHVIAFQSLLPQFRKQGGGRFVLTARFVLLVLSCASQITVSEKCCWAAFQHW